MNIQHPKTRKALKSKMLRDGVSRQWQWDNDVLKLRIFRMRFNEQLLSEVMAKWRQ